MSDPSGAPPATAGAAINDLTGRADSGAALLGYLCIAIGAVVVSTMWLLDPGEAHHYQLAIAALGAVLLGITVLAAPPRARRDASLWHVGAVLVIMGVINHAVTGSLGPYRVIYVLIFALVGLVHPPKTAFKLLPLALATYIVPEWTNSDRALALVGSVVAVPVWLLASEGLAHGTRRLKETNAALAERNMEVERHAAFQRDFVATASHELRTPMTSIAGYVELLEEDAALGAEQRRHVGIIARNANRLQGLVDDLLTLNRQETGHLAPQVRAAAIDEIVTPVVEAHLASFRAKGVTLGADVRAGLPLVRIDPVQIEQVVGNLMNNALKFTPPGGAVEVRCCERGDSVDVAITDTGPGIPPDEVDRVFDRFFRSSTSIKMAVPGTGLGLAIAKSMVESQGGRIYVESAVGEGTTFTVSLPTERVVRGENPGS